MLTPASNIFDKYSGGYEGSFADISSFFGGLDKLIGEPEKDVEAIQTEHCEVEEGCFGASHTEQVAGNYKVTFTLEREWRFVADPEFVDPISAGQHHQESGRDLGSRQKVR